MLCNGRRMKERTKAQRGKCSSRFLIIIMNKTINDNVKKQNRNSSIVEQNTDTENKSPTTQKGNQAT